MSGNVTKNSLSKAIFYEAGIPVAIAEDFLDSLFDLIIENEVKDGAAKIPKFGSFYVKNKKSRLGRNLNTQETVEISARKVVSFQPSNHLKRVINDEV